MGNISGEEDKDCRTRAEEERFYSYSYSGGRRNTGFKGGNFRHKPERVDRAVCPRYYKGSTPRRSGITGGILRQLIFKSRGRLAKLEEQVKEQIDEIRLLESALERVESIPEKT